MLLCFFFWRMARGTPGKLKLARLWLRLQRPWGGARLERPRRNRAREKRRQRLEAGSRRGRRRPSARSGPRAPAKPPQRRSKNSSTSTRPPWQLCVGKCTKKGRQSVRQRVGSPRNRQCVRCWTAKASRNIGVASQIPGWIPGPCICWRRRLSTTTPSA